jgi:pimeloyl-ACP methyl ester carboxylesterase
MIRKHGNRPYNIVLLHGGPGAAGEMKTVAEMLTQVAGILEPMQTVRSVDGQVDELHGQLMAEADLPVVLAGYSWGAWLAFLFAGRYPELVKKLILISAGPFESEYEQEVMQIRLGRLGQTERDEAEQILTEIEEGHQDPSSFRRFGRLMASVDSYRRIPDEKTGEADAAEPDMDIYQSVWSEASAMRRSGELIGHAQHVLCPVVAIHGDYDPHPAEGVENSLSGRIRDFRMIRLEKCGHTPWLERHARELFFRILREEITT